MKYCHLFYGKIHMNFLVNYLISLNINFIHYSSRHHEHQWWVIEFWTRWRHRQKCFTSLHNQKKDNNQFKNRKQPELPENQPAWKSKNPGVKGTFIKTGKRADMGTEKMHGKEGADYVIPHLCVDKPGGTMWERDRSQNPRFQYRKLKTQKRCQDKKKKWPKWKNRLKLQK